LLPLGWLILPIRLPALVVIGFWIVLQFFDEFVSITEHNAQTRNGGVAYLAHIGGFFVGFLLALLLRHWREQSADYPNDPFKRD
jgi:membrane associated rhomboid family serine protease